MARLIVTSRFLKSGSAKVKNYVRYIATREGVEVREQSFTDKNAPATDKQLELIHSLINDFPQAKQYHEYTDFQDAKTVENASELIAAVIERNADVIFEVIARNPSIDLLYEKWCELERQKYKTYTQKEKDFPPLTENKVFHSIRNEIIRQVSQMTEQPDLLPRDNSVHLSSTAFSLITAVANCIYDDYNQRFHSNRAVVDRKLRRLIREKKQAQGLQYEPEQSQNQEY